MKTLLEKANEVPLAKTKNINISSEEIELALAWIQGKIAMKQIGAVIEKAYSTNIYSFLAMALRGAFIKGKIKIIE